MARGQRKAVVSVPPSKPLWRRGVDAVDTVAAPVLESATRHDGFGLGLSLLQQTRKAIYRRTERVSRRVLHGLNLPSASDVNRLLVQIAAVENRVRQLDTRIEEQLQSHAEAVTLPTGKSSKSHPSSASRQLTSSRTPRSPRPSSNRADGTTP
jgi:hypothetical protein